MNPLLSIIIPVYNSEAFLSHAIVSALKTSINEIEIVIVDDASLGNCAEIVQKFARNDSRVKYVRHPYNKGLLASRFTGISYATGEYIVHLDADDRMVGDIYTKAYAHALDVSADVVYFNTLQCDDKDNRWNDVYNVLPAFDALTGKDILEKILSSHGRFWVWHVSWNKIIKRDVMLHVMDRFEKIPHIVMCEDLLWSIFLCIELLDTPKISAIGETGLLYFRHEQSITKRVDYEARFKKIEDLFFVFNALERILKQQKLWQNYHDYFLKLRVTLLKIHCFSINFKTFLQYLPRVIKLYWLQYRCTHILKIRCAQDFTFVIKILVEKVIHEKLNAITIFGTGALALELNQAFQAHGIHVHSFISSDTHLIGSHIQDMPVISINEVLKRGEKNIVVASIGSSDLIKDTLKSYASDMKIITMDC